MKNLKTIIIDVPWDYRFGRQVHRGAYRYARPNRPWLFDSLVINARPGWLRDANTVGIISSMPPKAYLAEARRYNLAAVGVGIWAPGGEFSGLPYVDVDPRAIGQMAAGYFIERGFRHFGMIDSNRIGFSRDFLPGYRGQAFVEALRRQGLSCNVFNHSKRYRPCGKALPAILGIDERIRRWLAGLSRPVAVFATNDSLAMYVCGICWGAGIRVPDEVAILGVDDDICCEMAHPNLSSIRVPGEQVGYEAARLLDALLGGRKIRKRPVLLPPVGVVTRQSTDIMAIEDRCVVEAVRFIREHAYDGIRVMDVVAKVPLSRRTLEQRFRASLGRSPFAEIRRIQIERVRMLLAQTDKTLEAIAPECGFDSVTRMSAAFRKAVGVAPGAYRRQFRRH